MSNKNFKELGLSANLLKVIEDLRFTTPSEIQEKAIPLVVAGKDVIGYSATGSGKTLAFGAGIVDRVNKGGGVQALIMAPTRELAEQVSQQLRIFSREAGLDVQNVYGGVSIEPQIHKLKRADVVVGTPGRILDHLIRETLNLKKLKILVLDEADRLVDMGFLPDVEKIIRACPKDRQTMLFSATSSLDIDYIEDTYMKSPASVDVVKHVDPSKLKQVYYDVPANLKFSLLVHLLKNDKSQLVMVFCNTKSNTDLVARNLKRLEVNAIAIHGGISQNKRTSIMKKFRDEHIHVLVCTDVAARGLDIKNVSHVYNYDSPKNSKEYIHRIGRTARAGEEGEAISIVSDKDYENFRRIYDDSTIKIALKELPNLERIPFHFKDFRDEESGRFGGRGPGRGRFGERSRFGGQRRFGGRRSSYSTGSGQGERSSYGRERNYGYRDREGQSRGGRFSRDNQRHSGQGRHGGRPFWKSRRHSHGERKHSENSQ